MAEELGVSRGSFYWHFEKRQDLFDALLAYWSDGMTEAAVQHIESLDAEPAKALRALTDFIINADLVRYDAAVRAWAFSDKRARSVLRRVDRRRIGYMTELFAAAGFAPEAAAERARLLTVYLIGERVVGYHEPADVRRRRLKRRMRLVLENQAE